MKTSLALSVALLLAGCTLLSVPAPQKSGLDLSNFERAVRPQDDLYDFANGGWMARTAIPADMSNYSAFTQLDALAQQQLHQILEDTLRAAPAAGTDEAKAADFYRSFMDEQHIETLGLAPLRAELKHIDAIATADDIVRYIGYNQTIGVGAPIAWSSQADARDARAYIAAIDQSGLTMPGRDYYLLQDASFREYRSQFVVYIAALLQLAGTESASAQAQARRILAFETELARVQWSKVENRDPVKTYNRMTLEEGAAVAPQFDWSAFFEAVGAPVDHFVISQPTYLTALAGLIRTVPVAQWREYFRFQLLDNYAPYLPAAFDTLHFEFHQHTLQGVEQPRPRWRRALLMLDNNIGEITGRLYVAHEFSPQAKQRARQLVEHLLQAYALTIDQLDWMSTSTRSEAKLKLAKLTVKIGYPDKWRDYSTLSISADDLVGNVMRSTQFELHRLASRLTQKVDRTEWQLTPQTVNAYYIPSMNEIEFPAAILRPPFFDPDADNAVNYGAIGGIIGHEISHAFDDIGRQYDADGNLRDWGTAADAQKFKERAAALVAQYGSYTVLDGAHVNGELTLGENIADVSGLSIAYRAYHLSLNRHPAPVLDGFSGEQRFFLGWAQIWRRKYRDDDLRMRISVDPHSPNVFRANGAASDNNAFYEAFGVKPGDRMYRPPAERVKLW